MFRKVIRNGQSLLRFMPQHQLPAGKKPLTIGYLSNYDFHEEEVRYIINNYRTLASRKNMKIRCVPRQLLRPFARWYNENPLCLPKIIHHDYPFRRTKRRIRSAFIEALERSYNGDGALIPKENVDIIIQVFDDLNEVAPEELFYSVQGLWKSAIARYPKQIARPCSQETSSKTENSNDQSIYDYVKYWLENNGKAVDHEALHLAMNVANVIRKQPFI
ncbi:hypothetical protein SJAG_02284 [Schizosaccharomyces japonicus yFS275]|uniref:Uncharacterized protein n=1 Tax=Schizosaccharomyces japonicus (strain yFS275 / FY16936) TaxID=402676 RepID=B6K220_SCHJY|nr:hypothetical protein SJAG_02284 [Schizosaccharomyces japonicus yFS275]EEB07201.2 hypothetical protein SJAG_02284 [Schizosaccharomyces japonicus yFS275]